jgi:pilus assembly protein TadC
MLLPLLFAFFAGFALILGFLPLGFDNRPKLQLKIDDPLSGLMPKPVAENKKKGPWDFIFLITSKLALFNRPLAISPPGRRAYRDLSMAKSRMTVEEFFLIKEILIGAFLLLVLKFNGNSDLFLFWVLIGAALGYMLPEFWLKARIKKIKDDILRFLPDTVDLLGLCVNAGLDFMMALKYVVEKSNPTVIIDELRNMMQEINVGKPRRDALRDLAKKFELPDLSTFSRTLIQADRMGTSVIEALNILSEDMREARFRRGEAMALKAPLKMLVPLLFFIFPVVAILVAGPVFLDFFQNNPLSSLGH